MGREMCMRKHQIRISEHEGGRYMFFKGQGDGGSMDTGKAVAIR